MFCIGVLSVATRIKAPGVPFAFAVYNQLSKYFPVTTTFTDTGAQADYAVCVVDTRYRAHQWHAIYGVGDWPIDNCMYARVLQSRHSFKNTLHVIEAAVKIRRAEVFGKVRVNTMHAKCFALLFIDADQQAFLLLPAIKVITRVADNRYLKIERF